MEHNALLVAAGDASDHVEQVECGEGDHCTSLGADKGLAALANAKCLEEADALWRTDGQAVRVCACIGVFDENFVHKSFQ